MKHRAQVSQYNTVLDAYKKM